MKSPKVRLYIPVRLPDGTSPFFDPVRNRNGSIKQGYALRDGQPQFYTDSRYYLRYLRAGKRAWESVGECADTALVALRNKEHDLQSVALGRVATLPVVEPESVISVSRPASLSLDDAIVEYLDEVRRFRGRRVAVCHFMLFMNEQEITHLELVKSRTITEFLRWAADVEYESAHSDISELVGFFRWAIQVGHRKSPCPVVPSFHRKKSVSHLPRLYKADEVDLIWRLAEDRGNTRIRAIIAIGERRVSA